MTPLRICTHRSAFTLIELLIVLLIIALLAAIVIPSFSSAAASARESNLLDNLRHIRTQILVFSSQHGGLPPGYPDGDRNEDPSHDAFETQLTKYTGKNGVVSNEKVEPYTLGPYLRTLPQNPINLSSVVRTIGDGDPFPAAPSGSEGWIYQPSTLKFVANADGQDKSGRAYFDY